MNVIETDLIKTRLQRNPDGSISQITEGTRREPERSSAFLSVEGRYVASSVTSLPFHVADVRASPSRMLRLPVRIGEAALDNVYTRVNIDQSVALIAEYAVASNWVLLESPASNVVGAEHRRTPNRAKGWALIASGIVIDAIALGILAKGQSQLSEHDRGPLNAFTGAMAAISVPILAYGCYLVVAPEQVKALP